EVVHSWSGGDGTSSSVNTNSIGQKSGSPSTARRPCSCPVCSRWSERSSACRRAWPRCPSVSSLRTRSRGACRGRSPWPGWGTPWGVGGPRSRSTSGRSASWSESCWWERSCGGSSDGPGPSDRRPRHAAEGEHGTVVKTEPRALARPPGPQLGFLRGFRTFRRDAPGFLLHPARTYGDVAWFRVGPFDIYLLSHPDHVRDVLVAGHHAVTKSRVLQEARRILGDGLLTSEGNTHKRNRRLLQPVFHHQRIVEYGEVMAVYAARASERWRDGQELDLHEELMALTLAIVGKTLFGTDVEEADAQRVAGSLRTMFDMYDRQIRDEATTIFLAGHETTSIALTWTFYLLSQSREVEERLHRELDEVLDDRIPRPSDLPRLEFTRRVFSESLRLYPPAWTM